MKIQYTKNGFLKLDFDDRCAIIEEQLPDEYYGGQTEINFYVPEGFTGKIGEPLPPTPPEIEKMENEGIGSNYCEDESNACDWDNPISIELA